MFLIFFIEIVLWTFLLGMCRSKLLMGFWLWRVLIIPSTHWFFFLADLDGAITRQGPVLSIKKGLRSLKTLFIRRQQVLAL